MIYLASPYSDPDPAIRDQRFHAACRATAALLRAGLMAFSPIVHCHPLVEHGMPTGWSFWQRFDREHMERCDEVIVLMLDGWERCKPGRPEANAGGGPADGQGPTAPFVVEFEEKAKLKAKEDKS